MPDTTRNLKYGEAANAALNRALAEDERTLLYGEDVGLPGGVFGISKGLKATFGDRVFDTPISESAILGSAVGAAMFGMRPIVEIMWIDFSLVALDQIVNQAANVRYVSEGRLTAPLTIRTQQGALPGSCAQHSQSLEAFFAHTPGIRVCLPWSAQDAYDMLLTAHQCEDPVIVIEGRELYAGAKQPVVVDGPVQPLGGCAVRRPGHDLTLISWGTAVGTAMDAAETLQAEGVDAEVIDVRWLNPLDFDTIARSVARTGRALVVHEANVTGGFGAEIAARLHEECFDALTAAVVRVGLPDLRMPAAPLLQAEVRPSSHLVAQRAIALLNASHRKVTPR